MQKRTVQAQILTAAQRALERCDRLASCTTTPGQITRLCFTPPMHEVHRLVTDWMLLAGMRVRVDAVGNVIGRYDPGNCERMLLIGSHLDTVPDAGRYDGILGVMLGLAAVEVLRDSGASLGFGIEVIGFSEEEGVRFSQSYLGSMAAAGCFEPELLDRTDAEGITIRQALLDFGLDGAAIAQAAYDRDRLIGYLEAHIEQGPVLDSTTEPAAIVSSIAGQSRLQLTYSGQAAHAGTCPMHLRRDALAAAAEFVVAVESKAGSQPGLVATVGSMHVMPGASNVIPGKAVLTLDIRHENEGSRSQALLDLLSQGQRLADRRGVALTVDEQINHGPVPMNPSIQDAFAEVFAAGGLTARRMVSGAGHDAAIMARICPSGMLFIRSPGGISHHPAETVDSHDVAVALDILVETIRNLSNRSGG